MFESVNFDLPSTWVKFRPSLCDGCTSLCCSLPLEIDKYDLLKLELISEDEFHGSLKKVARRLESEGIVKSFRASTGLFIMGQQTSGECIFLNSEKRCSVYEKRPRVCREFPKIGPRPGYCPCIKK
ncbi:MAG: YkgJ family cysteine cluster protein [Proteobacteria bacterium]|nr:YkgJ family cysteine cluster protein [Pseudomonadota bacterium]NBY19260.1 YkgJ family cysteine cluster protein [bacterium]